MTDHTHNSYLYLTTTGWKSGQPHEIEIWYVALRDCFYIVAEKRDRAHWVQNLRHDPRVQIRVGEQTTVGTARVVDAAAEPQLARDVSQAMRAKYGWDNGLIVELQPQGSGTR